MKAYFYALIILFLVACGGKSEQQTTMIDSVHVVEETPIQEQIIEEPSEKLRCTNEIAGNLTKVDTSLLSVFFYTLVQNQKYFLVTNGLHDYRLFTGNEKYGLADATNEIILPIKYDKIYHPNITLLNCFEIKEKGKIGVYNFKTKEIIAPQFDFILPAKTTNSEIAYGYKQGAWYQIKANDFSEMPVATIDFQSLMKQLTLNTEKFRSVMYHYHRKIHEDEYEIGEGIAIFPSFIDYLNVFSNEYLYGMTKEKRDVLDFTQKVENQKFTDKFLSFFVSIYETGIDGRGYEMDSKSLVVYKPQNQQIDTLNLGKNYHYQKFCDTEKNNYQFVNDSILEIKKLEYGYERDLLKLYDFQPIYSYIKVSKEGEIQKLSTNRIFPFTKFIIINESYFRACFGKFAEVNQDYQENVWRTDHLTIEDLTLMTNEIFAEYGYKFKSEKWNAYFSEKSWYKPLYDNVEDKLTPIDKANVELIMKIKKQMEKEGEAKFLNKRKDTYYAAG